MRSFRTLQLATLAAAGLLMTVSAAAHADVLASWDFNGVVPNGGNDDLAATVVDPAVTVTGSFSDANGIQPGTATLQICAADCTTNCQTVTVTATGSGYTASLGSPPLAAGSGSYCAKTTVQDLAGNTGTATALFSVDATPPVVTITGAPTLDQPTGGVSGTEPDGNPGPVTVTWCTESCASLAGAACPAADVAAQQTTAPEGSGNWSAAPPALADGSYCVVATATDGAGNAGSATATLVAKGSPFSSHASRSVSWLPRRLSIPGRAQAGVASRTVPTSWASSVAELRPAANRSIAVRSG